MESNRFVSFCKKWLVGWSAFRFTITGFCIMNNVFQCHICRRGSTLGPGGPGKGIPSLWLGPVVELRWGPKGPGPPERPGGPLETSVLRGSKGACKRPPEIARWSPIIYGCFIAICKCFCTEIEVEKHFNPPKCDFWRGIGGLKKFSRFAIARRILGLLMNYAVIRPLAVPPDLCKFSSFFTDIIVFMMTWRGPGARPLRILGL